MSGERLFLNGGTILQQSDTGLNDSDKTFTVSASRIWEILWIRAELITTATAGGRRMRIEFQDASANLLFSRVALNTQVASATETYNFLPGINDASETVVTAHLVPMPARSLLPAGYVIRIYDNQAIAAAADDLSIEMMVIEYVV